MKTVKEFLDDQYYDNELYRVVFEDVRAYASYLGIKKCDFNIFYTRFHFFTKEDNDIYLNKFFNIYVQKINGCFYLIYNHLDFFDISYKVYIKMNSKDYSCEFDYFSQDKNDNICHKRLCGTLSNESKKYLDSQMKIDYSKDILSQNDFYNRYDINGVEDDGYWPNPIVINGTDIDDIDVISNQHFSPLSNIHKKREEEYTKKLMKCLNTK